MNCIVENNKELERFKSRKVKKVLNRYDYIFSRN